MMANRSWVAQRQGRQPATLRRARVPKSRHALAVCLLFLKLEIRRFVFSAHKILLTIYLCPMSEEVMFWGHYFRPWSGLLLGDLVGIEDSQLHEDLPDFRQFPCTIH